MRSPSLVHPVPLAMDRVGALLQVNTTPMRSPFAVLAFVGMVIAWVVVALLCWTPGLWATISGKPVAADGETDALGDCDALGDTLREELEDGETDADALRDGEDEGDTDGLTLREMLLDAELLGDTLGEFPADGLGDDDGDTERDALPDGDTLCEGEVDALGDTEAEVDAEADATSGAVPRTRTASMSPCVRTWISGMPVSGADTHECQLSPVD